ncbi:uncharacterized protein LOC115780561 [Archocentrus centrarchus]|uniref:uncharacterized protein LOC115780561 n=1 Tax=Archocentrus centrarchus TaxID=63155 RepID=UPI0011E9DCAE|nr:uncharacterized protein LOC115780561 [Archocentrus centrarchus]
MSGCCVFGCTNRYSNISGLKLYRIPSGSRPFQRNRRHLWLQAINRKDKNWTEDRIKNARVCSAHFISGEASRDSESPDFVPSVFTCPKQSKKPQAKMESSVQERSMRGSRVRLKKGSVSSRTCLSSDTEAAMGDRQEAMQCGPAAIVMDHDYCRPPSPDIMDATATRIKELEQQTMELENQVKQLTFLTDQPKLNRFCSTDEEFRFFTQFPSEEIFKLFWESIEPSAFRIIYWTKAQREAYETPSPHHKLLLIDECFLFLCRIAAGLKEQALASMFKVSLPTVSRVIITWTSYFYLVLGSQPSWMTRNQVQATMPEKCRQFCPEVRVLIDCTEVCCETATSLTLQSESFTNDKNHTTFKGLLGVAPCGVITFVSKLYTRSISDQEMIRRSNFTQLLQPGDGVMADKGFQIEKILAEVGATLIVPPFKNSAQFSKEDAEKTQAIAHLRLLMVRAINRVKEYHIWDGIVPLSLTGSVNQLWTICCLMSNCQGPLNIKEDEPV